MMERVVLVVVIVVLAAAVGRWWQSRQGLLRHAPDAAVAPAITLATLVSTPTCRTCPQVRRALEQVARTTGTFAWDEVDATTDMAFVRLHGVRRAPTVLFRDRNGAVVARAAGAMGSAQVAAAVGVDAPLGVG